MMKSNLESFVRNHKELIHLFHTEYSKAYDPYELRSEKEWLDEFADWIKGGCQPYTEDVTEDKPVKDQENVSYFPIKIRFTQNRPGSHLDGEHRIIRSPEDLPMGDPFEVVCSHVHDERQYTIPHSTLEKIYTLIDTLEHPLQVDSGVSCYVDKQLLKAVERVKRVLPKL